MKSYRKELWFNIPTRRAFVNITREVNECLHESEVQEGIVLVSAMHITASVFINDDESGLHHDYEIWLEKLAPHEPISQYQHNRTGEDNADEHMKRQIMRCRNLKEMGFASAQVGSHRMPYSSATLLEPKVYIHSQRANGSVVL